MYKFLSKSPTDILSTKLSNFSLVLLCCKDLNMTRLLTFLRMYTHQICVGHKIAKLILPIVNPC